MGRKATKIEEQIQILQQRGMHFDISLEKVREHLLDIGYYRLGFYWNPFEIDEKHTFGEGAKISDAIKLYYLDFDLGFVLIKALSRIEVHIRTQIIYHISNKYQDSPTWFADPKVINQHFIQNFTKEHYKNLKKYSKPIKMHHKKYLNDKFAPAWKTLEFLSLGSMFTLYTNLKKNEDKELISSQFGIRNINFFENYFQCLKNLRNICAHGGLLYDSKSAYSVKRGGVVNINSVDRHSLYARIRVVEYYLGIVSENRKSDFVQKIQQIFSEFADNQLLIRIVKDKVGYNFQ